MRFKELGSQYDRIKELIDSRIKSVLAKGDFIQGEEVFELEKELAQRIGSKYCISCANGTEAIMLILMANDIGIKDAVFVPDITFIATANAAKILGASVIFVDIDPRTYTMSASALRREIDTVIEAGELTPKAIIAVDMNGLPADYDQIGRIAREYNLLLIEDAAQSIGGRIHNTMAGNFGNAAATSFFPTKPLGCYGDGGAVFCNDEALSTRINSIKLHGRSRTEKYHNVEIGINSRLDTIQAAILLAKIPLFFYHELNRINEIACRYANGLCKQIKTPFIPSGFISTFAYYSVIVESETIRNDIRKHLSKVSIETQVYYPKPLHQQPAYFKECSGNDSKFAYSIDYSKHTFALPLHAYINDWEVEFIIQSTNEYFR